MKGLNDFIISSKLVDLISICNDSDKVTLTKLLDKHHAQCEIEDGTIKECQYCKQRKHIDLFNINNNGKYNSISDTCKECLFRIRAKGTLVNEGVKFLIQPYKEKEDSLISCQDCPLSLLEGRYKYPNYESKTCLKCIDHDNIIRNECHDAEKQFRVDMVSVITDDHIELKVLLNKTNRKIAAYKKELRE